MIENELEKTVNALENDLYSKLLTDIPEDSIDSTLPKSPGLPVEPKSIDNRLIRIAIRSHYDLQNSRIRNGNRIAAAFRYKLGLAPSQAEGDDKEAEKVLKQLRAEFKRITDGVKRITINFKSDSNLLTSRSEIALIDSYERYLEAEELHVKTITDELAKEKIYTEYLTKIRGVGPLMSGVIVSEINIHKANTISALIKYCFPAGTSVNTPTGMQTIETLIVGDEVIDANGNTTLVKEVLNRFYKGNITTIETQDHVSIKSTDEHPFLVNNSLDNTTRWVAAADIQVGDNLVKIVNKIDRQLLRVTAVTNHYTELEVFNLHTVSNTYCVRNIAVHNCGIDVVTITDPLTGETHDEGRGRKKGHLVPKTYINKKKEVIHTEGISFNPIIKTKLLGVLATVFRMLGGEYRELYDNHKHRLQNMPKHQDKTKGHIHNMANREMIKDFLTDLWIAWRIIEGLEVRPTYAEEKLGIIHHGPDRKALAAVKLQYNYKEPEKRGIPVTAVTAPTPVDTGRISYE